MARRTSNGQPDRHGRDENTTFRRHMEHKRSKGSKAGKKYYSYDEIVQTWTCCECLQNAEMSTRLIDSCPSCDSPRCTDCPVMVVSAKWDGRRWSQWSESSPQSFLDEVLMHNQDIDIYMSPAPSTTGEKAYKPGPSGFDSVSSKSYSSSSPHATPSSGELSAAEVNEPRLSPGSVDDSDLFVSLSELVIKSPSSYTGDSPENTPSSGTESSLVEEAGSASGLRLPSHQPFLPGAHSPFENEFLDVVLSQFAAWRAAGSREPSGQHSAVSSRSRSGSSASPPSTGSNPAKKRSRSDKSRSSGKDDLGSESDENKSPSARGTKRPRQEGGTLPFACPYWKADPGRHGPCLNKTLNRVKDVKQHLRRCHFTPYCLRCGRQQVDRLCEPLCEAKNFRPKTLSWNQCEQFRRPARATPQEQWFVVWDLIFPQRQRPDSPYLDDEVLRTFLELRQSFHVAGHRIARDVGVAMELMPSDASESDNWLGHAAEAIFSRLYDEWMQQRPAPRAQQPRGGSQVAKEDHPVAEAEPAPNVGFAYSGELPTLPTGLAVFAPADLHSHSGVALVDGAAAGGESVHPTLIDTSWALSDSLFVGDDEDINYAFNVTLPASQCRCGR